MNNISCWRMPQTAILKDIMAEYDNVTYVHRVSIRLPLKPIYGEKMLVTCV